MLKLSWLSSAVYPSYVQTIRLENGCITINVYILHTDLLFYCQIFFTSQKDVQPNVADTVSFDKLADIMIDKMTQLGLIFASSPAVSQSSISGTVVQKDSLSAAASNAPRSGQDILCGNNTTVMHNASSHESVQDNNIQTVLSQPVAAAPSSSDKEVEQLLNGMPINSNVCL